MLKLKGVSLIVATGKRPLRLGNKAPHIYKHRDNSCWRDPQFKLSRSERLQVQYFGPLTFQLWLDCFNDITLHHAGGKNPIWLQCFHQLNAKPSHREHLSVEVRQQRFPWPAHLLGVLAFSNSEKAQENASLFRRAGGDWWAWREWESCVFLFRLLPQDLFRKWADGHPQLGLHPH